MDFESNFGIEFSTFVWGRILCKNLYLRDDKDYNLLLGYSLIYAMYNLPYKT